MSEIDIYNSIALKIRKLEKEKKKAKMTEEELRKSLEFVCEERIKLQEQVKELQQENERLNKDLSYYQGYGADMLHKNNILEERIEKAVEYINKKWEEHTYYERNENHLGFCEFSEFEKTDLLNILNCRSDE